MSRSRGAFRSYDGLPIAFEQNVGSRPGLFLSHATGFCKEVWRPVVDEAAGPAGDPPSAVAIDHRAHGDSGKPQHPFDWTQDGRDCLEAVRRVGPGTGSIGIGHSFGGAVVALAEALEPGTFGALLLIEPIVFPPPFERLDEHPLQRQALRRRERFPDRDSVMGSYRGRGPFAGWDDRALAVYVEHGFRDVEDGVALKCRPEDEAEMYLSAEAHGIWDRLPELRLPVVVAGGEHSDTHSRDFLDRIAGRIPDAEVVVVPDTSHFVPMEAPAAVAALALDLRDRTS